MYYSSDTILFHNGDWIKAAEAGTDLYAQTLHYGSGVFEGIRSYQTDQGTQIFKAREHFERLQYSAEKMHMRLPYSVDELIAISYELLERNGHTSAYIRPLVYLGPQMSLQPVDEVYCMICSWKWERYLGNELTRVMTSGYERPNPRSCHIDAKVSGHYINSILATTEAKQKGYDEALLLDMNGHVAEGSGANFFYEKDGVLHTPAKGHILPGITRNTIIELCGELNIPIKERFFGLADVYTADSAFFVGTAAEVAGISSLDDYVFPTSWESSLGSQLAQAYSQRVRNQAVVSPLPC